MLDKLRTLHGSLYELKQEIKLIIFRRFHKLRIMDSMETIQYIKSNCCSVARLGDGEIRLMYYPDYSIGFQNNDPLLVQRMKEVLSAKSSNLLVCLPIYLVDRSSITPNYQKMWEQQNRNWYIQFYKIVQGLNANNQTFGNASFTRTYIEGADKKQAIKIFAGIKSLWGKKDILIVEGVQTRMGVGNDLFLNAKSVKRILAPARNAFEKYDLILSTVLNHYSGELVLLSLGPTATILAYDLSKYNIQALDVGHIDLEYEWYLRGTNDKIAIPNKYVNEVPGGNIVSDEHDLEYLSQLICSVQ